MLLQTLVLPGAGDIAITVCNTRFAENQKGSSGDATPKPIKIATTPLLMHMTISPD